MRLVKTQIIRAKSTLNAQNLRETRIFPRKSGYLKCFWNQFKTVYLQGPCTQRSRISRPCCTYLLTFNLYLATSQHTMLFENVSVDYFMARAQFKLPTMLFFSVYRYFVCPLTHGARSHLVQSFIIYFVAAQLYRFIVVSQLTLLSMGPLLVIAESLGKCKQNNLIPDIECLS